MNEDIPYYSLDEEGQVYSSASKKEAYIDDGDLRNLLIEFLGSGISEDEIQKILDAASDEHLTEEDFDKLVDDFILKNKK